MDDDAHRRLLRLDDDYTTEIHDQGTGPAVILLHATPLDHRAWDGVFTHMRDHRVVAYDLRGHGVAYGVRVPSFYGQLAEDLERLLDALDIERAHVVGHGYGGEIAQVFALRTPERLSSLTVACSRADPNPMLAVTAEAYLRDAAGTAHDEALARWFAPVTIAANGPAVRYARARLLATRRTTYATALHTYSTFDVLDRLSSIDVPARVIAAEHDLVSPVHDAETIARLLPRADLRIVHGAGPMLPLEDPARFVGLLDHLTPVPQLAAA